MIINDNSLGQTESNVDVAYLKELSGVNPQNRYEQDKTHYNKIS